MGKLFKIATFICGYASTLVKYNVSREHVSRFLLLGVTVRPSLPFLPSI